MSDGSVTFEIRGDHSKLSGDLDKAGSLIGKKTGGWGGLISSAAAKLGDFAVKAANEIWNLGTAFEDGMAKVSTLVDTATVDMDALGDSLLDLSSKYGLEASSLAESAYNAISSNNALAQDTEGLMSVLESSAKLAKAGFTDLDTATSATLKTLNAYGLSVNEADRIQKILLQTQNTGITTVGELGSVLSNVTPTAAAMGVSFENVGAAIATMTAAGTPAAQATTQLNALMAELGKKGTTANKALLKAAEGTEYAGMSFQDMTAAGVPLNEIVGLLEQSAAQNGLTMLDMFSSIEAGKAALSITGDQAQTFTNNLEAMSTQTDVVDEGFNKVNNTASQRLNNSLNKIKNSAIELYNAFSPLISVLLDIASILIDKVTGAISKASEWIGKMSEKVKNLWSSITSGSSSKKSGGSGKSFAVGADYIPEDDYPALLHRGEAVLTAAEAKVWREGGNTRAGSVGGDSFEIDYDRLADAVAKRPIMLDGQSIEKNVSNRQARRVESMQRSGFDGRV